MQFCLSKRPVSAIGVLADIVRIERFPSRADELHRHTRVVAVDRPASRRPKRVDAVVAGPVRWRNVSFPAASRVPRAPACLRNISEPPTKFAWLAAANAVSGDSDLRQIRASRHNRPFRFGSSRGRTIDNLLTSTLLDFQSHVVSYVSPRATPWIKLAPPASRCVEEPIPQRRDNYRFRGTAPAKIADKARDQHLRTSRTHALHIPP